MNFQISQSYSYIDREQDLYFLASQIEQADRIALDTEGNGLHNYFQKVCLIQVTINEEDFIIDPLADVDCTPFLAALSLKPLIFHGGDYDLRMLRSTFGFRPHNEVFDTMLAAKLLGYEPFGLADILQRLLNISLCKKNRKSDWTKRPLSEAQLQYAIDDTRFLKPLADCMREELEKNGRLEWHRETCERMVQTTEFDSVRDPDVTWRIKGAGLLEPRQLNYLRRIWQWREREAQRTDRPPFKIMPNSLLISLSEWLADNPSAPLSQGPKLPRNCTKRRLRELNKAIDKARKTPISKWPQKRKSKTVKNNEPSYGHLTDKLCHVCEQLANDLGITPSVLAPRATLATLAKYRLYTVEDMMEVGGMMRWQAEVLKPHIQHVFHSIKAVKNFEQL